jgi:hypothetical protein
MTQHHKDRSGAPPHKQDAAQQRDPLLTKMDGPQQKQLTAPINHLKEEPSAPQSLSIFDSTQPQHKMHNRRRPL